MGFPENLKTIMREKKITAAEIATKMGVSRGTVTHWSNGIRMPGADVITTLAAILGVDEQELFSGSTVKTAARVPVVGTASCGGPDVNHLQDDGRVAYYRGDFYHKDLYCVIACGDSMAPEIESGDEVICDPRVPVQHGDMVHYQMLGESAIKVLVEDKEAHIIQLVPYNQTPTFKTRTIRLDDDEAADLKMAKVVAVNKLKFNNRSARLKLIGRA